MRSTSPPTTHREPQGFRLSITATTGRQYAAYVARKLREAHRLLKSPVRELSVALVGDRRMSQLHEQFMGIAGPTDVLSFPLEADRRGRVVGGEVVVCVSEALRQAKARRMAPRNEVLLYALHGLLHLSGLDDRTESDYKIMHKREDEILTRLGVGRVFEPPEAAETRPARARRGHRGDGAG